MRKDRNQTKISVKFVAYQLLAVERTAGRTLIFLYSYYISTVRAAIAVEPGHYTVPSPVFIGCSIWSTCCQNRWKRKNVNKPYCKGEKPVLVCKKGDFLRFFLFMYLRYSTLLHLPPFSGKLGSNPGLLLLRHCSQTLYTLG